MLTETETKDVRRVAGEAFDQGDGDLWKVADAVAARTLAILAARGGTMTEGEVMVWLVAHGADMPVAARHITSQGATVATLQAKVERLKAMVATRNDLLRHKQTDLSAAESRLAAIRERLRDMAHEDDTDAPVPAEFRAGWHAARKHLSEVLEGDAPQEAKDVPVLPGDVALLCSACGDVKPHRWKPSPEAGDFWRCSECGEPSKAGRHPCSPACTHDDAATSGHSERLKERSEAAQAVVDVPDNFDWGESELDPAERMRAACWEAVQGIIQQYGWTGGSIVADLKAAIEGAAP